MVVLTMKKYLLGGVSILLLLGLWMITSYNIDNIYILPGPFKVIATLWELLKEPSTYLVIGLTLFRLFLSLIISIIIGIFLGVFAGNYQSIDDFLHPIVSTLRSIPIASIIVIVLILMGHTLSLYIITFLMIFPIIYESTKNGVLGISQSVKNALALEDTKRFNIMYKIQLPLAMPSIRTGLFQSIGLGFKVIVMAEFISQTTQGIGGRLYNGNISINYAEVFAWTMLIIIIVIILEQCLKRIKKIYHK